MTKFKKKEHELVTETDKWTYFIKHAPNLKVIPSFADEEGLLTAFREADKHNWKKEELIDYDNASARMQDAKGEIELAREQGLEQGADDNQKATVIKLYLKGKKVEEISDLLDIDIQRITAIIEEYENKK